MAIFKGPHLIEMISFSHIYNEFYAKILHYLQRMVGENDAEDVAQVVFDKVNRNLGDFKGQSKISTWLYRIATNTALDKIKSSSYQRSSNGPLAPFPLKKIDDGNTAVSGEESHPEPLEQQLIRDEMSECVREFVDTLPPDYRTVIILNELEGFTNQEMADILQISLDTAKIRLHRARIKLKKKLESGCDFYHDERSELLCDRKQIPEE